MTVATSQPLSKALREATATAHENAEGSRFMEELLSGKLNADAVAEFTGQLWFVYEGLERAVRAIEGTDLAASIVGVARSARHHQKLTRLGCTALIGVIPSAFFLRP